MMEQSATSESVLKSLRTLMPPRALGGGPHSLDRSAAG